MRINDQTFGFDLQLEVFQATATSIWIQGSQHHYLHMILIDLDSLPPDSGVLVPGG